MSARQGQPTAGVSHVRTFTNGALVHYLDGNIHRAGGPAIISPDGTEEWYWHGRVHRVDGPAVSGPGKRPEYWVRGVRVPTSDEKFLMRLPAPVRDAVLQLHTPGADVRELADAVVAALGTD